MIGVGVTDSTDWKPVERGCRFTTAGDMEAARR